MSQNASVEERLAAALADVASLEEKLREQLLLRRQSVEPSPNDHQVQKLNAVIQKLSGELETVTGDFERLVESSKEMEEMLEKDLQDSKKTISSLQIRIEQLTKQLQVSQSNSHQILELQNQVQSLTAKNDNLEKKSVRLETENDALETKARKFETSYAKIVETYNEALAKIALLEAEIEELKEFKQRAKREIEESKSVAGISQSVEPKKELWSPTFFYVGFAVLVGYLTYSQIKSRS